MWGWRPAIGLPWPYFHEKTIFERYFKSYAYMGRNLHIIGAWVIALAVLGICSCTKGGTRKIEVNVSSITMEKEGGEVRIEAKDPIEQVSLCSSDKTSVVWWVDFGDFASRRYGNEIYREGFITPETLVIEANDWLTIIIPPYSPTGGASSFIIQVDENDSGRSREGWLNFGNSTEGQAWISFTQPSR